MMPLSWYSNAAVGWPAASRWICRAACRPVCSAGCASCGSGWSSISAMSPRAKMRSWPSTRRSGPVRMRPPRPCGSCQLGHLGGRGHPGGPHGDVAGQVLSVGQDDPVAAHLLDGGVQPDLHAPVLQLAARVLAQRRVEGQQQGIRLLDQADVHRRQVHLGERGVQRGAAQLGQRTGQLDPGRAAAHHGEVHALAGTGDVQPLQPGHDVVAQLHRVAAGVQAEAVLGGPGHPVVGRGHPGGQDQVVVVERAAVGEGDPAAVRVHPVTSPSRNRAPWRRVNARAG